MYTFIRRTHLIAAVAMFLFILMYAVSGYVLEFPSSYALDVDKPVTRVVSFNNPSIRTAPEALESIAYVKQTCNLLGKFTRLSADKTVYNFAGPAGIATATVSKDRDQITVKSSRAGFYAMLNRMHHLEGFDGGPIFRIWGIMLDLVAFAMILFALSGIYLWHKLTKRHALGWIFLGVSIAFTTLIAIYCLLAK